MNALIAADAAAAVNAADAKVDELDRRIARLVQERGSAEADLAAAHRNYERLPLRDSAARVSAAERRAEALNRQITGLTLERGSAEVVRANARRAYDKLVATARTSGAMAAVHAR